MPHNKCEEWKTIWQNDWSPHPKNDWPSRTRKLLETALNVCNAILESWEVRVGTNLHVKWFFMDTFLFYTFMKQFFDPLCLNSLNIENFVWSRTNVRGGGRAGVTSKYKYNRILILPSHKFSTLGELDQREQDANRYALPFIPHRNNMKHSMLCCVRTSGKWGRIWILCIGIFSTCSLRLPTAPAHQIIFVEQISVARPTKSMMRMFK